MTHKPAKGGSDQARKLALQVIYEVFEKEAFTSISLDRHLKESGLSQADKSLVTEIVNGTIRMVKHLDWVLNQFLRKPLEKQNPWMKNVLRMSVYQIIFMEKIPDYASVNSAVNLVGAKVSRGLSGVVNGVLRNIITNRDDITYPPITNEIEYLSVFYSQPEWLVNALLVQLGTEAVIPLLQYMNTRPKLTIRTNVLRVEKDALLSLLEKEGVAARSTDLNPWGIGIDKLAVSMEQTQSFQEGLYYVQNDASMFAAPILNAKNGQDVMDLCCGLGGKTTQIAEHMNNEGHIDAYDIYEHKINLLQKNCVRLGISMVEGHVQDLLTLEAEHLVPKVFLDAPCSGWGVLNRRADSRWTKSLESISELLVLQQRLLEKAAEYVAADGNLVYCTCTINQEENENVIIRFLERNSDFKLEGFAKQVAFFPLDESDQKSASDGMLTILPGKYGTDGMFYAKLKRI